MLVPSLLHATVVDGRGWKATRQEWQVSQSKLVAAQERDGLVDEAAPALAAFLRTHAVPPKGGWRDCILAAVVDGVVTTLLHSVAHARALPHDRYAPSALAVRLMVRP